MAHIVVLGGGIGGVSCAYELRHAIRKEDRITLVSNKPFFQFTPSNPWVAVKWRSKNDVTIDLATECATCDVLANETFSLEVKPPSGSYLIIQRTTPASMAETIVNLN